MGIALFVILVAIGALKLANAPTQKEIAARRDKVISELHDVEADHVTQVELARGDEKLQFTYSADADRWQMKKPIDVLADSSRVRDIVFALKNLTRRGSAGSKDEKAGTFECKDTASLVEYGLDTPSKTVSLTFHPKGSEKETKSVRLQVGALGADKESYYVKLPDEPVVFVVSKSSLDSLDKKIAEFRQQKLVTITRWDADRVNLEWLDRKLLAEKKDTKWRLVEPIQDRAESNKVEEWIGKLADVKVDGDGDFVADAPDDLAKFGLDKPALVAEIRKPGKSSTGLGSDKKKEKAKEKEKPPVSEKVLFGGPVEGSDEKIYAKLGDQKYVVAVKASVLSDLAKQPNDLRSHDLVELTSSDVDYVRIERASGAIALGKKDFDWDIFQPKSARAETTAVTDFVKKIDDAEIKEFIDAGDPKEYGLDQPAATVAIYHKGLKPEEKDTDSKDKAKKDEKKKEEKKDGTTDESPQPKGDPVRVLFGKRDEEKKLIYAQRGGESAIFAVADEGLWEQLDRDYLAYRRKQIQNFFDSDVAKLSIHRDGKSFVAARQKEKQGELDKETWRLTEPLEAPADSGTISRLLFDLGRLNAKKLIAEGVTDLEPYGLDSPKIRATVMMKAEGDKEGKEHVLLIGSEIEADGSRYAKLADGDLVFTVDQTVLKNLNAELHDHTVFKFDSLKVEAITLTWPDAKLELANKKPEGKTAKEWSVVGNDEFKLDTKKPQDLVNILTHLTTEQFAQYQGDFTEAQGLSMPALTIEVKLEGETASQTIRFGAATEDGRRYAAATEKSGPVALLPDDRIRDFLQGPSHFAIVEEKKPEPVKTDESKKSEPDPEAKPEAKKPDGEAKKEDATEPKPKNDKPDDE